MTEDPNLPQPDPALQHRPQQLPPRALDAQPQVQRPARLQERLAVEPFERQPRRGAQDGHD